ncbi:phosphoribosylaminoimidazolesuccinocarboxamide synthase [Candidatus Gottesmanbacteria bacterium]|nr:phosphoribosylaminoimidazolesuccinocarboxamide synthase [Candidatus Gottesmanbacteria bacterium]
MISKATIIRSLPYVLKTIDIPGLGKKYQGKVRDFYIKNGKRILITTDRQSAFDVILGHIPFKGAVLNLLSAFWFEETKDIVPNHMISVPDPNVMITRDCTPIPVEMIVRGYISGVTKTSIWYSYERGEQLIYGIPFPDGLKKNQKLPNPVITPTTHPLAGSTVHDERLTREQIIKQKIVPKKLYEQMERAALALFARGTRICERRGLILVDTKYEFGMYKGKLTLIDEIHTPDSSRFWTKESYDRIFHTDEKGEAPNQRSSDARTQTSGGGKFGSGEPDNFDKEFLRLWYAQRGYRGEGSPPKMPTELVIALARRYIAVYEKITGRKFRAFSYPINQRIIQALTT